MSIDLMALDGFERGLVKMNAGPASVKAAEMANLSRSHGVKLPSDRIGSTRVSRVERH